jgi:hypothetical protein
MSEQLTAATIQCSQSIVEGLVHSDMISRVIINIINKIGPNKIFIHCASKVFHSLLDCFFVLYGGTVGRVGQASLRIVWTYRKAKILSNAICHS